MIKSSPDVPIKITNNLYLGNFNAAEYSNLVRNNISAVVCLTNDAHDYGSSSDIALYHIDDISESLAAETFTLDKLVSAVDFIESQISDNNNVLVHCRAGASRSPTVVIAYVMKSNKLSPDEARDFVYNKAKHINPTFMDLLLEYEYYLKEI